MSKRPIKAKQIERLRRALQPGLPAYIDLVEYLTFRRLAQTRGEARKMLLDGKVTVESHKVGRMQVFDPVSGDENDLRWVVQPLLEAQHRGRIQVATDGS